MANLDNVSDVFAGATVVGTTLTINNIDTVLPKFNQGDNVAEGAELIYALVDKLASVVGAAGHSSLSTSTVNTFDQTNLTMTRNISIATTLDIASNLDNMDVKLDSSNIVPNLTLGTTEIDGSYSKAVDTTSTNLFSVQFTSDGVAVLPSTIGTDFTLSVDDADFSIVDDSDVFMLRLNNASKTNGTYNLTISVEDNRLGYDQYPAVTASATVEVTA